MDIRMEKLRFGIIGAGNVGQSAAALLASQGYSVKLMDIKEEVVDGIKKRGKITLFGKIEAEGMPELVTVDAAEAIKDTDMILVIATSDAHEEIAKTIAKDIQPDQMVLLIPGMFGGTLAFKAALKQYGCPYDIEVAETADSLYGCRSEEIGRIYHFGVRSCVKMAAVPSSLTQKFIDLLQPVFPNLTAVDNIWEFAMGNSCVLHCIPMLMNVNKMDLGEEYDYYMEGVTESIAKIAEEVDKERVQVCRAFGLPDETCEQWIASTYNIDETGLWNVVQHVESYRGIKGPGTMSHRFCTEDTFGSLAPIASVAKELGIPTPAMDAVLFLIGTITGIDYTKEGRTAEKMNLKGKTVEEMYAMVR